MAINRKLLHVEDIGALFRLYTAEPNQGLVSDNILALWLGLAYEDFRTIIAKIAPELLTTRVGVVIPSGKSYVDLSTTYFLDTLDGTRIKDLLNVYTYDGVDVQDVGSRIRGAPSSEILRGADVDLWFLDGSILRFSARPSNDVVLEVILESTVDWAKLSEGDNEYVDDFEIWHDLIALLACGQYEAIQDMQLNAVRGLLLQRKHDFINWLQTRTHSATSNTFNTFDAEEW